MVATSIRTRHNTQLYSAKTESHWFASFPHYWRKKCWWWAQIYAKQTHRKQANKHNRLICVPNIYIYKLYSTCLENNLLAADTSSLQVNEGSHLLGPGMLSNETVTGLIERRSKTKTKKRETIELVRETEREETFYIKWQSKEVNANCSLKTCPSFYL